MERVVLLALSSFRFSEAEVERALARCREDGARLRVLYVVDVNIARYFSESGVMAGTTLREQLEAGAFEELQVRAQAILDEVCSRVSETDVTCEGVLRVGRFAEEVTALVRAERPQVVIATRAQRPEWLRRLFGSPVDRLEKDLAGLCELEILPATGPAPRSR